MHRPNLYHYLALFSLLALITLGLIWERWFAPFRPDGSWLILKIVPLLPALQGILRDKLYTYRWTALLSCLYFCEGTVRAITDSTDSQILAIIETALATILWASCNLRVRASH